MLICPHHRVILVDSTVWIDQPNDFATAEAVWFRDTIIGPDAPLF
jgi:hypothetical protein